MADTTSPVTGTLSGCGVGHLAGNNPWLVFRLAHPGYSVDGTVFAPADNIVFPGADGSWSVQLAPTELMVQDCWYSLEVHWLEDTGNPARQSYPDWRIRVPLGGGDVGEMIGRTSGINGAYWRVDVDEPQGVPLGTFWLDPETGDVKRKVS